MTLSYSFLATDISYLSSFHPNDTFICYTIFKNEKPQNHWSMISWILLAIFLSLFGYFPRTKRSVLCSFLHVLCEMWVTWCIWTTPAAINKHLPILCQSCVDSTVCSERQEGSKLETFLLYHWERVNNPKLLNCGQYVYIWETQPYFYHTFYFK